MLLFLLKAVLLCFPWGPLKTSAIVSLTSTPLFTMDALNSSESEEPKQAFTVLLDVSHGTTESDTATDGGTQESAVTSMLTPVANNVAGGVENTIKVQELTPTSIDPTQLISPGLFTNTNIEKVFSTQDSPSKDIGNNTTVIPLLENNKAPPYDDPIYSFLEIPRENNTTEKQCFCNIPGPEGQKGDKGERGDPGSPGIVGENGQQGFEGTKGNQGQKGSKGEKGQKGSKGDPGEIGVGGPKGEPGDTCPFCEKGEKGNKGRGGFLGFKGEMGEPGFKGDLGPKGNTGEKGSSGAEGPPGKSGEVGQKGSMGLKGSIGLKGNRGIPGSLGAPGVQGLAGMPGRKGEKGEKGACAGHENIAFSVGLEQQNNILLPGSPLKFDKVFVNENNLYSTSSGVFVASIEGVYYFQYQLSLKQKSHTIGLVHNGKIALRTQARQSDPNIYQASGSVLMHLIEDDEIWLQVLSADHNAVFPDDKTDSIFLGFLLFPLED